MIRSLLFPSDVFDPKTVDEDMKQEYQAALDTGKFEILLFSYNDWFNGDKLVLSVTPPCEITAIYRGWMMKPEKYTEFYSRLLQKNVRLITDPDMYSLMHQFPNVYPLIREDTAAIETFPLHEDINVEELKKRFPRFMVKDYVKSVKGTEFPACFDQSVTQEEFNRWMDVFYKYRADLLTGGICIKEFLDLKRYDGKTNEYRVFYTNHHIGSVSRNSLQRSYTPEPPSELIEKYRFLDSVFYTIDFAELEDGQWKIIEVGDGSVSGLSDHQDYQAFFRTLYYCFS